MARAARSDQGTLPQEPGPDDQASVDGDRHPRGQKWVAARRPVWWRHSDTGLSESDRAGLSMLAQVPVGGGWVT